MQHSHFGLNFYSMDEICKIFYSLNLERRCEIYEAAMSLEHGSRDYRIARSMGFGYDDSGLYRIPAEKDIYVNYERNLKISNLLDDETNS